MSRRYIVELHTAELKPVFTSTYEDAETALGHFTGALSGAGHDDYFINRALRTWTCVLMKGGSGFTMTDPDLKGSVTIRITK